MRRIFALLLFVILVSSCQSSDSSNDQLATGGEVKVDPLTGLSNPTYVVQPAARGKRNTKEFQQLNALISDQMDVKGYARFKPTAARPLPDIAMLVDFDVEKKQLSYLVPVYGQTEPSRYLSSQSDDKAKVEESEAKYAIKGYNRQSEKVFLKKVRLEAVDHRSLRSNAPVILYSSNLSESQNDEDLMNSFPQVVKNLMENMPVATEMATTLHDMHPPAVGNPDAPMFSKTKNREQIGRMHTTVEEVVPTPVDNSKPASQMLYKSDEKESSSIDLLGPKSVTKPFIDDKGPIALPPTLSLTPKEEAKPEPKKIAKKPAPKKHKKPAPKKPVTCPAPQPVNAPAPEAPPPPPAAVVPTGDNSFVSDEQYIAAKEAKRKSKKAKAKPPVTAVPMAPVVETPAPPPPPVPEVAPAPAVPEAPVLTPPAAEVPTQDAAPIPLGETPPTGTAAPIAPIQTEAPAMPAVEPKAVIKQSAPVAGGT